MKQTKKVKMITRKIIAKSITESKVMIFKDTTQAEKYGFNRKGVSNCINGHIESYKGYTWEYIWLIHKLKNNLKNI